MPSSTCGDQLSTPNLALASMLAKEHRAFLIDADNEHVGWLDLDAAAADGRAYVVTVAADVLAWDLDTEAHAAAGDRLAEYIADLGWPVLRVNSGRAHHRHVWAVVPGALSRGEIKAEAHRLNLPAPRQTMRPPCSPHRLGLPVTAVDDLASFVARVTELRGNVTQSNTGQSEDTQRGWRHTLLTGKRNNPGDPSDSATVFTICVGAIRAGLDIESVRALLANPSNIGGRGYRKRKHAAAWLDVHVWPDALRSASRPPGASERERKHLDSIAAAVEATRWKGVAGATDRAVILAIIGKGQRAGRMTPTMSFREIAEAAPCSLKTVTKAVPRLKDAGWLQTVEAGRGRTVEGVDEERSERADATVWRILCPVQDYYTGGTPPVSTRGVVPLHTSALDVCRWGKGLGLNARRVLEILVDSEPLSSAVIAERLGMTARHLRSRLLPRLAEHGLLVVDGDCWSVVADLDEALVIAASELDLLGHSDRVKAKHQRERERYLQWREDRRSERERRSRERRAAARLEPHRFAPFHRERSADRAFVGSVR